MILFTLITISIPFLSFYITFWYFSLSVHFIYYLYLFQWRVVVNSNVFTWNFPVRTRLVSFQLSEQSMTFWGFPCANMVSFLFGDLLPYVHTKTHITSHTSVNIGTRTHIHQHTHIHKNTHMNTHKHTHKHAHINTPPHTQSINQINTQTNTHKRKHPTNIPQTHKHLHVLALYT